MLEALGVALRTDGTRGLFRGTVPLLSREVPFYVVGMTGYAYLKRVFDGTFIDESSLSVTQSCPCNKPYSSRLCMPMLTQRWTAATFMTCFYPSGLS